MDLRDMLTILIKVVEEAEAAEEAAVEVAMEVVVAVVAI